MTGAHWHILYLGFGAFYILSLAYLPYPLDFLVKAMPILLLAIGNWVYNSGLSRHLLTATLVFSATGDILLAIPFSNSFLYGLGAFLVAQCFYQINLWRYACWKNWKLLPVALVIAFAFIMLSKLLPNLDKMQMPVIGYVLVICTMTFSAIMAVKNSFKVMIGAMVFLVSDAILAWDLFMQPVPYDSYLIMITYYIAQYLLVCGIIDFNKNNNATT